MSATSDWPPCSESLDGARPSGIRNDPLVALQHADGYWELDEPLAMILGVSLQDLVDQLASARGDARDIRRASATALALTFLEGQASSNKSEWEMLAAKATRWLDGVAAVTPDGRSWLEWARALT